MWQILVSLFLIWRVLFVGMLDPLVPLFFLYQFLTLLPVDLLLGQAICPPPLTRSLCVLQVLKPVSEHYMEDNVRQTVVNSIKASLTEQAAQHTKLKTH